VIKEARIILPVFDNRGYTLDAVHARLQRKLAHYFGGFTATDARGGWVATGGELIKEQVTVYDIAVDDQNKDKLGGYEEPELARNFADGVLIAICTELCIDADQVCIYYRNAFTGEVRFISRNGL
jgi:hypothetical protein